MLDQYLGVIITFGFAAVIVGIMCGASMILGVHHPERPVAGVVEGLRGRCLR